MLAIIHELVASCGTGFTIIFPSTSLFCPTNQIFRHFGTT